MAAHIGSDGNTFPKFPAGYVKSKTVQEFSIGRIFHKIELTVYR